MVVLEIGVGGYERIRPGGSLAVWRDYLVRSTIVGLDISEKAIRLGKRVKFHRADQNSPDDLEKIVRCEGAPSVVIDDGSHVGEHIKTSFEFLWPLMPPGGLYVIEDLSTSYYPDFGGGDPPPASSAIGLLQELVDCVQAQDNTFARHPQWGERSEPAYAAANALHVYPGIAFLEKLEKTDLGGEPS